ncbi:MAG: hypothetical protein ACI9MR_000989 [Myxococcota bacterium]|jgi:hypothetical protein
MLDTYNALIGLSTALEGFYEAMDLAMADDDVTEVARLVSERAALIAQMSQLHALGHVMPPEIHADIIAREVHLRQTLTSWRDLTSAALSTQNTRGRAVRAYAVGEH